MSKKASILERFNRYNHLRDSIPTIKELANEFEVSEGYVYRLIREDQFQMTDGLE